MSGGTYPPVPALAGTLNNIAVLQYIPLKPLYSNELTYRAPN